MSRKLFISASLSFSVIIILLGGYNCASQYDIPGPGGHGGGPGGSQNPYNPTGPPTDGPPLPDPPDDDDECNRSYWREKINELGAASAYIRTDRSNFTDFNLGQPANFSISCTRLLLNMSRVSGGSTYKGNLHIVYEEGNKPVGLQYNSGNSAKENKYNKWYGDWRADRRGRTTAKFNAIFQHNKMDMAVILQINKVEEVDVGDGVTSLRGYGDIWFKMFRLFTTKNDVCHHQGAYVKYAQRRPPRPQWVCWLVPVGAYSCRPEGIDLSFNLRSSNVYSEKPINLRSEPACYSKFGSFLNLDINQAFNVSSGRDHP